MGNKTAYKEERQTKKKEKKWAREKDQNRFAKKRVSPNFGLYPFTKKQKRCLVCLTSWKITIILLQN